MELDNHKLYKTYKNNKYELKKLIYKLNKKIWDTIEENKKNNKFTDKEIWENNAVKYSEEDIIKYFKRRSKFRSMEIYNMLRSICRGKTDTPNYLDIGTGYGMIAYELNKLLSDFYGKKMKLYGTDIIDQVKPMVKKNMIFAIHDENGKLPENINKIKFKVITILMVLHHIEPKKMVLLIKKIYKILAPGGYIIIREHNVYNKKIEMLTYIQHDYYHHNYESSVDTQPELYLMSAKKMIQLILDTINVEYIKIPQHSYPKMRNNPTKQFYCIFRNKMNKSIIV